MKKVLLVVALVVGFGFSGLSAPFSGSWEMDIIFAPRIPITCRPVTCRPITGFSTILTIDHMVSDWTFRSVSRLGGGSGWYRQDFLAEGTIGAFELVNHLRFVPADPSFTWLRSTAAISIDGIDLTGQFLIVENGSGFAAGFSAPVEDLTFAATAYFGSLAFDPCPEDPDYPWVVHLPPTHTLEFRGLDVDITMPFYSTTLTIDIDFVTGFEDITFTVPRFPLGIPQFTLDLKVKYTLERKAVTITPHITVGDWLHFQPFISIAPDPFDHTIEGLILEGLRLEWFPTDQIRFRYHFDTRPNIEPNIVRGYNYCPIWGCPHQQMVELRYKAAPITLTMAGFWYSWCGIAPLPMFPNWVDINLVVDVLPGFTVYGGLYIECAALAFITFGFTVTW